MTDLKSEKWLWLKGGLFVMVAMLSVFLLAVDFTRSRQFVLLMLAIWASCRAYYFCFYVIEKYIDREYRFAGLVYLPQYMFQRWNGTQNLQQSVQPNPTQAKSLSWFVFWPCVFCCGNVLVPALASTYFSGVRSPLIDYVIVFAISTLFGQIAFVCLFAVHAKMPLKFRLPLAIGMSWLFTFLFIGGMNEWQHMESVVGAWVITTLIVLTGFGLLTALKHLTGKNLLLECNEDFQSDREDREGTVDTVELGNRLSIRYLFGATTIAAILSASARFFDFSTLVDEMVWRALLLGILLSTIICYETYLCLELFLQRGRISFRFGLLAPLCLCLILFPFAAYYLAYGLGPANGVRSLSEEIPLLACYEAGYLLMLSIMLLHARSQGIRYGKPR